MSARADMDRDIREPVTTKEKAAAKAATAERVGITAREQAVCRVEGWKACMRTVQALLLSEYASTRTGMDIETAVMRIAHRQGRERWGDLFDEGS